VNLTFVQKALTHEICAQSIRNAACGEKGQLSILSNGPVGQVRVQALGYTVPASDAPAYTPVVVCSTAASACG
jgi:hypothetical protein